MQKNIKHLLLDNIIWLAIIVTICIAYLSLIEISDIPVIQVSNVDKIYHVIAYFTLTLCWLLSLKDNKYKYSIVIACIFYGIIIEVLQSEITMYRTGDFLDFLANTFGAVLALLTFNQKNKKKRFN